MLQRILGTAFTRNRKSAGSVVPGTTRPLNPIIATQTRGVAWHGLEGAIVPSLLGRD